MWSHPTDILPACPLNSEIYGKNLCENLSFSYDFFVKNGEKAGNSPFFAHFRFPFLAFQVWLMYNKAVA
jgi:hypothetical protein